MKRVLCTRSLMTACIIVMLCAPAWGGVKRYNVPEGDSPYIGPKTAKLTIIEFIDYQ